MMKSIPFTTLFCWLSLLCCFSSTQLWAQEPCTIDLTELMIDAPPSGSRICIDEPINLPNLSFVSGIGDPNPAIVWTIYNCPPNTTFPLSDDCTSTQVLADSLGNIIFGSGLADLRQNTLFDDDSQERTIFLVPVIVPNAPNTIPNKNCSGVVVGFNYPSYTVLNPALNEEDCGDLGCPKPVNDDCVDATPIDLLNIDQPILGTNVCATSNGDPNINEIDCFQFDIDGFSHSVWYQFTGNGGSYTFAVEVDCIDSIELQINDPQMTLYQGSCDNLGMHVACHDDGIDDMLPTITDFETTTNENYLLIISGAATDVDEGHFCINITETAPACLANVGTVTPPSSSTSCDGEPVTIDVAGATAGDYSTAFLVDDGTGMGFVLSDDDNITLNNTGTSTIDAAIYAINFLEEDRAALNMALMDMATLEDILALINNETICAAIDNTGVQITVLPADDPTCVDCLASFGTVTVEATTICSGEAPPAITFTVEGDNQDGHTTIFLLDNGDGTLTPSNDVLVDLPGTGDFTIYAFNYLNEQEATILNAINNGASISDLMNLIASNTICGALQMQGTVITVLNQDDPACFVCMADIGIGDLITPDVNTTVLCAGVNFEVSVAAPAIEGYTNLFVLSGDTIIYSTDGNFAIDAGTYTLNHISILTDSLVIITTALDNGDAFDAIVNLINEQQLCAAVNTANATLTVLPADAPECGGFVCEAENGIGDLITPDTNTTTLCAGVNFSVSVDAPAIDGYTNLFILSSDTTTYSIDGNFAIDAGTYTLNHISILTEDLAGIIEALENGANFSDIVDLIAVQQLCAAVNTADATLTVLPADAPECGGFVCEAENGIGDLITPDTSAVNLCAGRNITFGVAATAPNGYSSLFILTDSDGNTIYNTTGQFNVEAGSYTLNQISVLTTDLSILTDTLDNGAAVADLTTVINDNDLCALINEASFDFTVLAADDPACTGCQANAGTVTPPEQTLVPASELSIPPTVTNQFEDEGYIYVFVLTTDLDTTDEVSFNIVAISETGSFDFEGLGLETGKYQVHGLSFQGTLEELTNAGLTTGEAVLAAIENGLCADLTVPGYCTTSLDPLMVDDVQVVLNPDGTYTVTFVISGGSGVYVVDGDTIQGNTFESDSNLLCDEMFSFIVTDSAGSTPVTVAGDGAECPPDSCMTAIGTLPTDTLFICDGDTAQVIADNVSLMDNDILVYALSNVAGDVVAFNTTGQFTLADISNGQTNEVYTVSAIAGIDEDGDGFPDLDQVCTVRTTGSNIVFLTPVQIVLTLDCNPQTGESIASIVITGGLPAFDSATRYTISGDFAGEFLINEEIFIGAFTDGATILLTATDGVGCSSTVTQEVIYLPSECVTDAGMLDQTTPLIICDRGTASITTINTTLGINDILVYVLRNQDGDIIIFNATGQFAFADIPNGQTNETYTLSAIAGIDENGDGLPDVDQESTDETESVSVTFLDPIQINLIVGDCNEQTGEVQAELSITGGLPAFDNTQEYAIIGSIGNLTIGFNETVSLGGFTDGATIEFTATDQSDCAATATSTIACMMVDVCETNPIIINADTECNTVNGEFNVIVSIDGGLPSMDSTATYTIEGSVSLENIRPNQELTIGPFPDGTTVSLSITDAAACTATYEESVACEKCSNDAGTFPNILTPVLVCADEATTITTPNDPTINAGSTLVYVVHTESTFTPTTVLGFNTSGTFSFTDLSTTAQGVAPAPNQQYFVSAVVGIDRDGDGFPEMDEEACFDVTDNNIPIVFLTPIEIIVDGNCDEATETFTAVFTVRGGLPAFDASTVYNISGAFNGSIGIGESINVGPFQDGESYSLTAIDNVTCSETFFVEDIECTKTPIELLSFEGEVLPTGNLLTWSTASEINSDFFTLERSTNGVDFEIVATLKSAGNSTTVQHYNWLDKYAPTGIAYYRLVETDVNGEKTISGIISLTRGEAEFGIHQVSPIPAQHFIEVSFEMPFTNFVSVSMYDLTGKEIMSKEELAIEGINNLTIEVEHLSAGLYFLSLTTGEQVTISRFIKD